jgi:serine/threonine protein phosphatase PrpC
LNATLISVSASFLSLIPYSNEFFLGLRPQQEDRVLLIPEFFDQSITFCGIFDGTVSYHASEYVATNIADVLRKTEEMKELVYLTKYKARGSTVPTMEQIALLCRSALRKSFLGVDKTLLEMCAHNNLHYTASTGVTALLWKNLLTVAHVGDSKACIMRLGEKGEIMPEWLTVDHKPNMPHELKRIQENGGSCTFLHGNKPYIRGADFLRRLEKGEHPKQLNYSRAFGGKDLKMYGLSADPDINHFEIGGDDKLVLIGSDGLWDVLNPRVACQIAMEAKAKGRSASQDVVEAAIRDMPKVRVADNVSCIAIFLNESQ